MKNTDLSKEPSLTVMDPIFYLKVMKAISEGCFVMRITSDIEETNAVPTPTSDLYFRWVVSTKSCFKLTVRRIKSSRDKKISTIFNVYELLDDAFDNHRTFMEEIAVSTKISKMKFEYADFQRYKLNKVVGFLTEHFKASRKRRHAAFFYKPCDQFLTFNKSVEVLAEVAIT